MIKSVKWKDHPSLGNLELNFCKDDGTPYNTIILAGENGTGKTTVLETLSEFLNDGSIKYFDYIKYDINNDCFTVIKSKIYIDDEHYHTRINDKTGKVEEITRSRWSNSDEMENDINDIRKYGCIYSRARSGFHIDRVEYVTISKIDVNKYENDEEDNFTPIIQMIIDIKAQDNEDWANECKNGTKRDYNKDFFPKSRMYRFESAFNTFFEYNIKFKEVSTLSDRKDIIFEKHGKDISINNLSTGEKQIVFRGAHLLKNSKAIEGGFVLIDEPELSMHPKWQEKILQYYRNLFTENGKQKVQMIFATHSEYVLKEALNHKGDILILALKDDNGTITSSPMKLPLALPTITSAEINYRIFDIISTDYHIQLYGYLQTKENKGSISGCDDFIESTQVYKSNISKYSVASLGLKVPQGYHDKTLPTYIRNAIDHPDSGRVYSEEQLRDSIELLIKLCK